MPVLSYVSSVVENNICTVEFFHPQSNALPSNLLQQLAEAIETAGQRPDVHVIVLQSGGEKSFCAGANFDELLALKNTTEGQRFFSGFAAVINACRLAKQFVIARVQGKAIGGGVGLAAAADYCLATSAASIRLSELAIGIGPFVIGPAVERKIGKAAFMELSIDAQTGRSAEWALSKGLYAHLYATIEELDVAVAQMAQQLATSSPAAIQALKQVFWSGTEHWDGLLPERAGISGQLVLQESTQQYLNKFRKNA